MAVVVGEMAAIGIDLMVMVGITIMVVSTSSSKYSDSGGYRSGSYGGSDGYYGGVIIDDGGGRGGDCGGLC